MKRRALQMQPLLRGAALLTLSLPASLPAGGQTVPEERLDPGYRREAPALPDAAPEVDRAVTEVAPVTAPAAAITGIRFKGAEVPERVADASQKFLGRPADTDTLKALAATMTAAYRKSDVALFTLAIPHQDLSDGIVDVHIAEGHVSDIITLTAGQPAERPQISGFFAPLLKERPASRASFERGVSLSRRQEGQKVSPRLATTGQPGAVAVLLDAEKRKNEFALGYDSRESRLVDSGRISATGAAYGTLRRTDALRGRISVTPDGRQSRSASAQYKTPIGSKGVDLSLAAAWQETRPSSLEVAGDATFLSAGLSYPLLLDFRREVSVNAAIDRVESRNTALGSVLANEQVTAARLGLRGAIAGETRSASASLTYSRGLDTGDARSSVIGSDLEFDKVAASANAVQKIGASGFLRVRAAGQWTDAILPANERLLIGGVEFGRGFRNGFVSFDKGYAVSVEPAWRPRRTGNFARSEVYLFADHAAGEVTADGVNAVDLDLSSAGLGARLAYKDMVSLGLEYAEPVNQPVAGLKDEPVITFSWSFRYRPD